MYILMEKKTNFWFYIIALLPPLMGAMSFIVSKYGINEISPISLLFYRWVVAILVLTPFVFNSFIAEYKNIRFNIRILSLIAVSGVTLFNFFLYYSLRYTTPINSSIIASLFPIILLFLGAVINGEKINKIQIISIILALIGAVIIISHGCVFDGISSLFSNLGDFLALAAATCFAFYFFTVKLKPQNISFYPFLYSTFLIGTILILPLYLFDVFYLGNLLEINARNIIVISSIGIGVSVIGTVSLNQTILRFGSTATSVLFYLTPMFTAIMAVVFLNEEFEFFHFIGMFFILFGVNFPLICKSVSNTKIQD